MSITEAEAPQEQSLSRPDQGDIFLARREDLRLVKQPQYPKFGQGGRQVGVDFGEAVQFRNNRLFVPHDGDIELADGRRVEVGPIREWLLEHKGLGNYEEGFWRVDPVAPPVSEVEMQVLMDAAMKLDEAALEALLEQERQGWQREAVLNAAGQALERIQAMRVAAAEQAAKTAPKGK